MTVVDDVDDGLFAPDSVIRRVDGENALLLGGGRALLMQLAHPLVAAGVAEHSEFRRDPFSRLQRTLDATYTVVFGTKEQAERVATGLRKVHDRVVGPGYHANDPELLLWVHATLVDTAWRVHSRFIAPLSAEEAETYYRQSMVVAEVLGVPMSMQPANLREFRDYVRTMVGSLEVTDAAREVARAVLHPRVPWPTEPVFLLVRQVTAGLLPRPLRVQYGLGWDRNRKAALLATGMAARLVLPRVPAAVRRAPLVARA